MRDDMSENRLNLKKWAKEKTREEHEWSMQRHAQKKNIKVKRSPKSKGPDWIQVIKNLPHKEGQGNQQT